MIMAPGAQCRQTYLHFRRVRFSKLRMRESLLVHPTTSAGILYYLRVSLMEIVVQRSFAHVIPIAVNNKVF
jgi:hypothetical protein